MDIKTLTPDDNGQVDWPALSPDRKAVVTVGVFDGMHQGHRAVIGRWWNWRGRPIRSPW